MNASARDPSPEPNRPPATPDPRGLVPEDESPFSAWVLLGAIAIAKLATLIVVLIVAWDAEAAALIGATTWFWLPPAIALLAGPYLFWRRLRRVRARREQLRRQEWMLPDESLPVRPEPARR